MSDILSVNFPDYNLDGQEFIADLQTIEDELKNQSVCELIGKFSAPYHLSIQKQEGKIIFTFFNGGKTESYTHIFSLMPYRSLLQEYADIKESYREVMQSVGTMQLETIDMARRGIHNEAAELLKDSLASKIKCDFETARLLFSLIALLVHLG